MSAAVLTDDHYAHIEAGLTATTMGRAFLAQHEARCRMVAAETVLARLDELKGCIAPAAAAPGDGSGDAAHLAMLRLELRDMGSAITQARREIAALKPESGNENRILAATEELDAIVTATERATSDILNAAEAISGMSHHLAQAGRQDLSNQLLDHVTSIFTACSFQDITGQRTTKVVHTLRYIEQRINAMMAIWDGKKQDDGAIPPLHVDSRPDAHLMNGPALPAEQPSQDDIDALFVSAPSAPAGQSDIDALFDAPAPQPAAPSGQSAIDALFDAPTPQPVAPSGQPAIDALFDAPAPQPAAPSGQPAIDALFDAPAPQPAAPSGQSAIDALFDAPAPQPAAPSGQSGIEAPFDAPAPQPQAPAHTSAVSAIEALFDAPAPAPEPEPGSALFDPPAAGSGAAPSFPAPAFDALFDAPAGGESGGEPDPLAGSALFDPAPGPGFAPPPATPSHETAHEPAPPAEAEDGQDDQARLAALDLLFPADAVATAGQPVSHQSSPLSPLPPRIATLPRAESVGHAPPAPMPQPAGGPARALAERLEAVIGSVADPARPAPHAPAPHAAAPLPSGSRQEAPPPAAAHDPAAMDFTATVPNFLAPVSMPDTDPAPVAVKRPRHDGAIKPDGAFKAG